MSKRRTVKLKPLKVIVPLNRGQGFSEKARLTGELSKWIRRSKSAEGKFNTIAGKIDLNNKKQLLRFIDVGIEYAKKAIDAREQVSNLYSFCREFNVWEGANERIEVERAAGLSSAEIPEWKGLFNLLVRARKSAQTIGPTEYRTKEILDLITIKMKSILKSGSNAKYN